MTHSDKVHTCNHRHHHHHHHQVPPWIVSFDLFRDRRVAMVSWDVVGVCSWGRVSGVCCFLVILTTKISAPEMLYWSLSLFCLKLCIVDEAHLCRAWPWRCLVCYVIAMLGFFVEVKKARAWKRFFYPHLKITPTFASCYMLQILA